MNLSIFSFKNHKALTIFLVSLIILTLTLIIFFVRIINPHRVWEDWNVDGLNSDKPNVFFMQQSIKPIILLNRDPNVLVVGTSRAVFGYSDKANDGLYYNGAMAGASMYSNKILLDYAEKFSNFNRVILFVDFFSFNEYGRVGKDRASFYDVSKYSNSNKNIFLALKEMDLWGYYFFSAGLFDAIKTVKINQTGAYNGFDLQENGSFNYSAELTENLWKGVIRSLLTNIWFPKGEFCFYDQSGVSSNYLALEEVLQKLYKKDISVDIVITPVHFYTWSALYEANLGSSFAQWKADLVQINEKVAEQQAKKPFLMWDFTPVNEYSTASRTKGWFYDPSHMSKKYGEIISKTIRDGDSSSQLNSSNLASKLNIDERLFFQAAQQYKNDELYQWLKDYVVGYKKDKHICSMNTQKLGKKYDE